MFFLDVMEDIRVTEVAFLLQIIVAEKFHILDFVVFALVNDNFERVKGILFNFSLFNAVKAFWTFVLSLYLVAFSGELKLNYKNKII